MVMDALAHETPLITTIVAGLGLAFVLGAIAVWLRISPLVGYLLAGVLVGPFTPGYVADQALAPELAEIGVILLMFGVGLHFSLRDLLSVKAIAIPGAVVQIVAATAMGLALAHALGWSFGGGLVFGLALSVASTVVLLRAMQERRLLDTDRGRIAVGWLIVEDLVMVLALVLLPALASLLDGRAPDGPSAPPPSAEQIAVTLAITIGKVAAFVALMLIVGRRVIPWILHYVAHTGSRELFRLAVLALALGVAYGASTLFGVSFALGAFFAGMILSESPLSQRAAEESLPLRDAFAVLFFVSVGMLFDPAILTRDPWPLIATFLIIVLGKSIAAFLIVLAFRYPVSTALTISASLAQIGEFSFILIAFGVKLNLLPGQAQDLVVGGAILSILANPLFFALLARFSPAEREEPAAAAAGGPPDQPGAPRATTLAQHYVLVGCGRVGQIVADALRGGPNPLLVIEERLQAADRLRATGIEAIVGNAAEPDTLQAANLAEAKALLVAIPNGFEAGQIVEQARTANGALEIIVRAHTEAEVEHFQRLGASLVIMGEREIALGLLSYLRDNHGESGSEAPKPKAPAP
jgi:CPA2 family monovalent cation:H+ antiporter-2